MSEPRKRRTKREKLQFRGYKPLWNAVFLPAGAPCPFCGGKSTIPCIVVSDGETKDDEGRPSWRGTTFLACTTILKSFGQRQRNGPRWRRPRFGKGSKKFMQAHQGVKGATEAAAAIETFDKSLAPRGRPLT
jgi:hypothetical protein